jgi:hypothetical protein
MTDMTRRAMLGSTACVTAMALLPVAAKEISDVVGPIRLKRFMGMDLAAESDAGVAWATENLGPYKLLKVWRDGKLVFEAHNGF